MKTLKVGIASYEEMKERTLAIARGELKPSQHEPKIWFTSIKSLAQVLSEKNRQLLDIIIEQQPSSITELEHISGRAKSNLSRTLNNMARFGLVELTKNKSGTITPHVPYENINLDLQIGIHR